MYDPNDPYADLYTGPEAPQAPGPPPQERSRFAEMAAESRGAGYRGNVAPYEVPSGAQDPASPLVASALEKRPTAQQAAQQTQQKSSGGGSDDIEGIIGLLGMLA